VAEITQIGTIPGSIMHGIKTRAQLARELGKSTQTIKRYEALGLPVTKRGQLRLYDDEKTRAWLSGELPAPPPRGPGRPRGRTA
jgi:hypothetical protein